MEARWEAIFWDVGGVILSLPSVQRAHASFVEALCAEHDCATEGDPLERWRSVVGAYFADREECSFRPAREAYARGVEEIVAGPIEESAWRPLFETALEDAIEPNPGAVATVRELAATDLHVGIVSDVDDDEGRRILDRFDLLDVVDSVTTSEAVGHTKPHPAMFETALETAGVPAARSLMIGDRYRNDMEGASDVGMATIAYGAEDGPAVDYRVEELPAVLAIVAGERSSDRRT